jgi:hypothetical protein
MKPRLIAIAAALLLAQSALAGPPLLCQVFDIGGAKSLPWQGSDWAAVRADYDANRLVEDTLALLGPETPVIVRMETLRRATLYARKDGKVADSLLARLKARAADGEAKGKAGALALFDAGYLVETYRQAYQISKAVKDSYWKFSQADPGSIDGYAWIVKAIQARGGDPEMEFAAALASEDPSTGRKGADEHLRRAVAGARKGSLLARNLEKHFEHRGKRAPEFTSE